MARSTYSENWSEHFDRDLRAAHQSSRNRAIGESIRLAKAEGIEVTHRPRGWRTRAGEEDRYWHHEQVNIFVDYLADKIYKRIAP